MHGWGRCGPHSGCSVGWHDSPNIGGRQGPRSRAAVTPPGAALLPIIRGTTDAHCHDRFGGRPPRGSLAPRPKHRPPGMIWHDEICQEDSIFIRIHVMPPLFFYTTRRRGSRAIRWPHPCGNLTVDALVQPSTPAKFYFFQQNLILLTFWSILFLLDPYTDPNK